MDSKLDEWLINKICDNEFDRILYSLKNEGVDSDWFLY